MINGKLWRAWLFLFAAGGGALSGCTDPDTPIVAPATAPHHIGTAACATCHIDTAAAHQDSHHALAMQSATAESIVAVVSVHGSDGVYRDGAGYWFADGGQRFPVTHTFGVYPLQQYLIDAPAGRKQALTLAWDDRSSGDGGQRWFELYPASSPSGAIHYTSRGMTWNSMCADCHSTGVVKGFAAGHYTTTYVEDTVGCEACHGPGSTHRDDPTVTLAVGTDACMPCHSRRTKLRDGYLPGLNVFDFYRPVDIAPPLYHADGQIDDEVYVWGSFQQSRMSAAGVTCTDCHDVHRAGVAAPTATTCVSCHSTNGNPRFPSLQKKSYAPADHFGANGHADVDCIDCHMPSKIYMGVDVRHDHSFRIPEPGLATKLESLDACGACHTDSSAALGRLLSSTEPSQISGFGVLASAHLDQYEAIDDLIDIASNGEAPLLQRTQAIRLLARYDSPRGLDVARRALSDPHPLARIAAVWALDHLPPAPRWGAIKRLLGDPVRAVRFAVIDQAIAYLNQPIEAHEAMLIETVLTDYRATLQADADHPESHVAEGSILHALGQTEDALRSLDRALEIEPQWIGAFINRSIILEELGEIEAASKALARATEIEPKNASAFYAKGLFLIRNGQRDAAAEALTDAHTIDPDNRQIGYAAALARAAVGDIGGAIVALEQLATNFGPHASLLIALATHLRDAGRSEEALTVAQQLVEEHGASFTPLLQELEQHLNRR